ncbi:glycosyltransferase family 4 protein [Haloferax sp. Atlit-4N]|uniref:glycosyltransferase family 4 protein n=1 Tax=Haloferax sp. Atlit-4N TaxID=2077206 RepID=UPI001314DD84|nr:glycosyltransferase family 4 protein [Haloferax sp. Atlit-4N]
MKIAIVTPNYPPNTRGGGELSAQLLAEQFVDQTEHSVVVHSFDGRSQELINGVHVVRHRDLPSIPELSSIIAIKSLWDLIEDYDIIHGYNMELHPAVGFLSKHKSIASVAHLNSYTFVDKNSIGIDMPKQEMIYNNYVRPSVGRVSKHYLSQISTLIALSNCIKGIYDSEPGIDTQITQITNMIDPSFTPESVQYTISGNPQLLYVGSLKKQKGVEHLIRSIPEIKQQVRLTVVGDGPERERLRQISRQKGVDEQIEFVGQVPHSRVDEYYEDSDIFVHPGTWPEPLNRTLLEAIQHGLAVVVTRRGGPPEIIQDSNLLADPGNPAELANAIKYAIENRKEAGEMHRQHILKNHHPSTVIAKIEQLYRRLTNERPP